MATKSRSASRRGDGVHVADASMLPWQPAGKPGLALKPVRMDNTRGHFLGLVGFEPMTRSGLHQHQGVATSFFVDGSLHDYQGSAGLHEAGINVKGATHDAVAYQRTLLVSRLEAPVTYPPDAGPLHGLHAGAHQAVSFANPKPLDPPDLNVAVDHIKAAATGIARVTRQLIYDYSTTGDASQGKHRMVQLRLWPGATIPRFKTSALIDGWVRGGAVDVQGKALQTAHANCFFSIAAQTEVQLSAPFGALLLLWAEGDVDWQVASSKKRNLLGF